jgi:hypothetical protein
MSNQANKVYGINICRVEGIPDWLTEGNAWGEWRKLRGGGSFWAVSI